MRAIYQFTKAKLHNQPLRWVKTAHAYPSREALIVHKRPLSEVLADLGYVTRDQIRRALQAKPPEMCLGEYLVNQGRLTGQQRDDALSIQQGAAPEVVPPVVAKEWHGLPVVVERGPLQLAQSRLPPEDLHLAIRMLKLPDAKPANYRRKVNAAASQPRTE